MGRRSILVIDDERSMRHMLTLVLERGGYDVTVAEDGEEGLRLLAERPELEIVLTDVRMPKLDGIAFLKRLGELEREVRVVVMSAYGTTELAIEAMKAGAADYISKPFNSEEILLVLGRLQRERELKDENRQLRDRLQRRNPAFRHIVGNSRGLRELLGTLERVAGSARRLLVTGESGTGKELIARAYHELAFGEGSRAPYVAINCAAIPENLLESELFGHEKGAFTGAHRAKAGLFESASGGTLFLDEIGELPVALQSKLLRVLEEGAVRRVGGDREVSVDVRVVAATSRDLPEAVNAGEFRSDLFYRLNVIHLLIPPLRERREDIPLLTAHFLTSLARESGGPPARLSGEAADRLSANEWPGNIRQLENALERAVLLCRDGVVEASDLPPAVAERRGTPQPAASDDLSFKRRIPALERELIVEALRRSDGNKRKASEMLEISYKALLYKIRGYGLEEQ